MTFRLEKVDDGDGPFEVDISESLIPPGKGVELRVSYSQSGRFYSSFLIFPPYNF